MSKSETPCGDLHVPKKPVNTRYYGLSRLSWVFVKPLFGGAWGSRIEALSRLTTGILEGLLISCYKQCYKTLKSWAHATCYPER